MNIFDWIVGCFNKVRDRFFKKKQEYALRDRITKMIGTSQEDIQSNIIEKVRQEASPTAIEISELAKIQSEIELQELITPLIKIRRRVYDFVEIEQELTALNKKLLEIQIKQNYIEPVHFPQNYKTDKDIEELEQILQKYDNKQNLVLSTSAIDKLKSRFGQFDKFLQERILLRVYQIREEKRVKEEETKKQHVNELIGRIENLIKQGNLQEAQNHIVKVASSIAGLRYPEQKKTFRGKLEELKSKLRDRQIREEAKRQAEELKNQQEEAERKRLVVEARHEEERQRREQAELIQRQEEEKKRRKEEEKKQELQRLLVKKSDWKSFEEVLKSNGIITFYHFTDKRNLQSIKQKGGLYSWHHCNKEGIHIPYTGGSPLGRNLDKRYNLHDYVRLSFCEDHPMQLRLLQSGYDLVVLEISIEVAFFENTRFSDINATDNGHKQGKTIDDLKRVRFSATKRNYIRKEDPDFKYHQAEIMVKTWIPIEYITNINQF